MSRPFFNETHTNFSLKRHETMTSLFKVSCIVLIIRFRTVIQSPNNDL